MEIVSFLADFAQVDVQGKIHAIGLGWSVVPAPLPAHSLAILFRLGWDELDVNHTFSIDLIDEDGHPVLLPAVVLGEFSPIHVEGNFLVSRPSGIAPGSTIAQPFAATFGPGMQLPVGRYEYRVTVGDVSSATQFTVIPLPA